jgi:enediyne polyketide synthase
MTAGTSVTAGMSVTAGPDVFVSAGGRGRVAVLFGGLARAGLAPAAGLAASLAGLRTLDLLGVRPVAGVGYGLGELAGLVWAGCLPPAEAARLAAQVGQVLRGYGDGPSAMARVAACERVAGELSAGDGLHIAAYEGPRSHLLAGSTAGIRNLTRRAAAAGVPVEVLDSAHALHSPAMAGCTAPLRSILAGTRFGPAERRLISTVTGRQVMPGDNVTELLAGQLSRPVLFAQAMTLAAEHADLIVVAGPDDGLVSLAAGCCAVPVAVIPDGPGQDGPAVRNPAGQDPAGTARLVAALFAAGAISDVTALSRPAAAPTWTVPRMRDAEPEGGQAAGAGLGAGTAAGRA